ncbi:MAG TPA: hypothetical protein VF053_00635 [Streptosporangiales bacterium]
MKAAVDAAVRTTVDVTSDFRPDRTIPRGTQGHVLEAYESPREGYAVELDLGDDDVEVVTLYPEQFDVVD